MFDVIGLVSVFVCVSVLLKNFGFFDVFIVRLMKVFSGGWRVRTAFAAVLFA